MATKNKIFVLDTNVLIHDPNAILRFHEHDVYIPIVVLEELEHARRRGASDIEALARIGKHRAQSRATTHGI